MELSRHDLLNWINETYKVNIFFIYIYLVRFIKNRIIRNWICLLLDFRFNLSWKSSFIKS